MRLRSQSRSEILKGTLDMMILRTLVGGELLVVERGSLYPAPSHTISLVMIEQGGGR